MSESTKGSGAPADASGAQTGAENKDTKITTTQDLDRALKDLHKYKSQAKEYETKLSELEQGKLMAEGKKDELITSLQKQLTETKASQSQMQKTFALDKVQGWLKTKAATSGIIDGGAVEKFVSLIDFKGRNPFRDDSTFQLEENVLAQVFEESKKEMPYFFGKPSPSVKDITPGTGTIDAGGEDFSKLSLDQLKERAKNLSNARQ